MYKCQYVQINIEERILTYCIKKENNIVREMDDRMNSCRWRPVF